MNKQGVVFLMLFLLFSCKHPRTLSREERMICGRWKEIEILGMTSHARFSIRANGDLIDFRGFGNSFKAKSWHANRDTIWLTYQIRRTRFYFIPYDTQWNDCRLIKSLTDSTLILTTIPTKLDPKPQFMHLKKMKLNGKYLAE